MSKKPFVLLNILLICIILVFQNCSGFETSSNDNSNNSQSQNNPDFHSGQNLTPDLVPANIENLEFANQISNYPNAGTFKAIAINKEGDGLALGTSDALVETQEEWNRVVLERCQLRYENKPCSLFAEGDTVKFDVGEYNNNFEDLFLDIPQLLDASRLPGVIDYWRNQNALNYQNSTNNFQALAVNYSGTAHIGWAPSGQTGPNNQNTQEEANRRALEFCEAISYGRNPCFLHTIDDTTIWNPTNTPWEPVSLKFAPEALVIDEVPFITEQDRENRVRPVVEEFLLPASNFHFLVVMGRFGRYPTVVRSPNPITNAMRTDALVQCDLDVATAFPAAPGEFQQKCFIYSEDMAIVMTPDSYGRAAHSWHPDNRL